MHCTVALSGTLTLASRFVIYKVICFINHYLSASLLQPDGVKHDVYDRLSHIYILLITIFRHHSCNRTASNTTCTTGFHT
jgi:hypothetical protein